MEELQVPLDLDAAVTGMAAAAGTAVPGGQATTSARASRDIACLGERRGARPQNRGGLHWRGLRHHTVRAVEPRQRRRNRCGRRKCRVRTKTSRPHRPEQAGLVRGITAAAAHQPATLLMTIVLACAQATAQTIGLFGLKLELIAKSFCLLLNLVQKHGTHAVTPSLRGTDEASQSSLCEGLTKPSDWLGFLAEAC